MKDELEDLSGIVNAFLDLAEGRAKRLIPMTMQGWVERINKFLLAVDRDNLENAGKISMEIAKEHAEMEYEKYRIVQARLFNSDFDKMILDVNSDKM